MHFRWITEYQHRNGATVFHQVACGDQAVTAVVAFAAQHYDVPAMGQFAQNKASHGPPGMLHQFER